MILSGFGSSPHVISAWQSAAFWFTYKDGYRIVWLVSILPSKDIGIAEPIMMHLSFSQNTLGYLTTSP